jgi:hypothetical protein
VVAGAKEVRLHSDSTTWLGIAILIVCVGGPLLLAMAGIASSRRGGAATSKPVPMALIVNSAVLYALAYNLTFFLQELFLVVPKALTPGLRPTLFHNNHTWAGDNPLAQLFQGTGALAILISGAVFAALAAGVTRRGAFALFCTWMAYHGLVQGLAQIPTAVLAPDSDVGRAFAYLAINGELAAVLSVAALGGLALVPQWLTVGLLEQATDADQIATPGGRTRFAFFIATLPAIIGTVLTFPFRVPGEIAAVAFSPIVVAILGVSWIQAGAWGAAGAQARGTMNGPAFVAYLLLVALFAAFHLILAPGVRFY